MQYLLMIYSNEAHDNDARASMSQEEQAAWMGEWFQYTQTLKDAGVFVGGDALQPTPTATTVSWAGEKVLTTDGPFAETKEQLGGYYLIDVENLDDAIAWAGKMPHSPSSKVEVRPVMVFE